MQADALQPSVHFKSMAKKAVWSIVLFVVTYLLLIVFAVGLTVLAAMGGILIIAAKPMFITVALGLGLMSFGLLILIFLVKFIARRVKIDRSHLTEIKPAEQPELFKMIAEIVNEVGTDFPKRIYLSSEVNASVFYNSSFWSMFFPVRKNLQIGVGLMNAVSIDELKAILAHEFGHFSQKSMRVGAYVYNVNRIIYNVLNENDGFGNAINKWASVSNFISLFVILATKVIEGIQYVLRKVYNVVNLSHLALSREMEFHADAVAAHIAGSKPLISSLLRLQLADYSLNQIYLYYDGKISANEKTNNIFPQHYFLMRFFAGEQNLQFEDGLPLVLADTHVKYDKSKLIIKDQWASHPSTTDRIAHLEMLNLPLRSYGKGIAVELLQDKDLVMQKITAKLFDAVKYASEPNIKGEQDFEQEFLKSRMENILPKVFNGYFDYRNPYIPKGNETAETDLSIVDFNTAFSDDTMSLVYEQNSLNADLATLKQIATGELDIKTFDYNNIRYSNFDAAALIIYINNEIKEIDAKLDKMDQQIHQAFIVRAQEQGLAGELAQRYKQYGEIASLFTEQDALYVKMAQLTSFMFTSMDFDTIEQNVFLLKKEEKNFKSAIQTLLSHPLYILEQEIRENLERYLKADYVYFVSKAYIDQQVSELVESINTFGQIIFKTQFEFRKTLLEFEAGLVEAAPVHVEGQ